NRLANSYQCEAVKRKGLSNGLNKLHPAFKELQQAMIQSSVLALPNFEEECVIEIDASGYGVGVVLQHKRHLIDYRRFNYEIEYKKGKENVVADALSRVQEEHLFELPISANSNELIKAVKSTWVTDPRLKAIIEGLQQGIPNSKFTWSVSELRRKGLRRMVKQQVHLCYVCQRNKSDLATSSGLLQPLKIPERV
nr:hypothetical protein [Tanacetum cinerariifolium]